MEDKLLVYRCKRGSDEALTRIYQKYKADLLLLGMALLNDRTVAEDVVHDVFVSFVQGLDRFRLTGSLKGFLLTCVAYRGFALDQDTGGAIRAPGRCDVYMGQGDEAGHLAGQTYQEGRLYYLFLRGSAPAL